MGSRREEAIARLLEVAEDADTAAIEVAATNLKESIRRADWKPCFDFKWSSSQSRWKACPALLDEETIKVALRRSGGRMRFRFWPYRGEVPPPGWGMSNILSGVIVLGPVSGKLIVEQDNSNWKPSVKELIQFWGGYRCEPMSRADRHYFFS